MSHLLLENVLLRKVYLSCSLKMLFLLLQRIETKLCINNVLSFSKSKFDVNGVKIYKEGIWKFEGL